MWILYLVIHFKRRLTLLFALSIKEYMVQRDFSVSRCDLNLLLLHRGPVDNGLTSTVSLECGHQATLEYSPFHLWTVLSV